MTNFNQKRAEKSFRKEVKFCHETVNPEGEEEFVEKVKESIKKSTPIAEK